MLGGLEEDPRVLHSPAPDHHPVGPAVAQAHKGIGSGHHIPAADHRDAHVAPDLGDPAPVGAALVGLLFGARVQGQGGDAGVLGDLRRLDIVQAGLVPAGAELQRHRHAHGGRDGAQHLGQLRQILEQGRAVAAARHLGRGAAAVDVDDIGAELLDAGRRRSDELGLVTAELHRQRALLGVKVEQVVPLERLRADAGGVGHLGADQAAAAQAQDDPPEDRVRHPGHRRQDDVRRDADVAHAVAVGELLDLFKGDGHDRYYTIHTPGAAAKNLDRFANTCQLRWRVFAKQSKPGGRRP